MNVSDMKRIGIYLFTVMALCACSGGDDPDVSPVPEQVPVVLDAGIPVVSRAVIENGGSFTAGIGGWETASASADYSGAATWYTTAGVTASASARAVTLSEAQHYNGNNAVRTCMLAWHPAGEPADGKVSFPNADGTVDVMLAGPVSGSKDDNTGKVLEFTHRSTQLKFKVVADPSLPEGTEVRRITVKEARLPVGFDLADGKVLFGAASPLDVPGLETPVEITGKAATAGMPVMVMPMDGNTVRLEIETSDATYGDVTAAIDGDSDFVEGKAYAITLTFRQQSLGLSAIVAEWTSGTGSAEVL